MPKPLDETDRRIIQHLRDDGRRPYAVIARDDVPAQVAEQVAKALAGLDQDPAVDQAQFRIDQQHFELADNKAYDPVIEFLRRYDAAIGLPEQIKLPKGR